MQLESLFIFVLFVWVFTFIYFYVPCVYSAREVQNCVLDTLQLEL